MVQTEQPVFSIVELPVPGAHWVNKIIVKEFDLSEGKKGRWEFIKGSDRPTMLLCGLTPDKKLILVKLFRIPANTWCTEMPGGLANDGEPLDKAAMREFVEETGYKPSKVTKLSGGYIWNGKSDQQFQVWLGENCKKVSEVKLDPVEEFAGLTVITASKEEVRDAMLNGDITIDANVAQAIWLLEGMDIL